MEFANGHYGLIDAALAYSNDHTAPTSTMITMPEGSPTASSSPIQATFKWGNEPSVIYYTLDGIDADLGVSEVGGPGTLASG